ncbi:flagellar hook-basal body complex protein FliE [Opitutaceae bacterium EW11]|nr:flagellar hook-basal body complex protein FliE [Opitutaceae bacterium EW11]
MSLIGSIGGLTSPFLNRLQPTKSTDSPTGPVSLPGIQSPSGTTPTEGFGKVMDQMISSVDAKQNEASAITRDVLMGKNDQVHQSMIAMQEASVAFQLMVEVRNKVVDSYQELMRMAV